MAYSGYEIISNAVGVDALNRPAGEAMRNSIGQLGRARGAGSAFALSGNLYTVVSAGANPAGTASDYCLATFTIPANAFDVANRGIILEAVGAFASNTNTKTLKVIVGATTPTVGSAVTDGTTIATLANSTTAGAGGFALDAAIFKYGAAAANTQIGLMLRAVSGNANAGLAAPTALTQTESSPITLALTGNAATTATDIALNLFRIFAMN